MMKQNKNIKSKLKDKSVNASETTTKQSASSKKLSEYGKQLKEKQRVKRMYGMRERQFLKFFKIAVRSEGIPGENLLSLLERRLDNVVFRLKLASSRAQARQMVNHGHIMVNGKKVDIPSFLVSVNDLVALSPRSAEKDSFIKNVVEKRLSIAVKVPEWLELIKKDYAGRVLRGPKKDDLHIAVEDHLIVELYSK